MLEIGAVILVIAGLIAFRLYAARQIAARRGIFVWAFAFPIVLGPAVMIWAGLGLLSSAPLFGVLIAVGGAALGGAELLYFRRAARAVSGAAPDRDLWDALDAPTTDLGVAMTVGGLLFTILVGIGLVVWVVISH